MDISGILIWNVRGLNQQSRRDSARALIAAANPKLVCLQETKIQTMTPRILLSMLGTDLDHHVVPAEGTRGGILVAWSGAACQAITTRVDTYTVSVLLQNNDGAQ